MKSWYWRRKACTADSACLGGEDVRPVLLSSPLHLGAGQPPRRVDVEASRHLVRRELVPANATTLPWWPGDASHGPVIIPTTGGRRITRSG